MKKFLPAFALVLFLPAFALSAEKIAAPKPDPSFLANLNEEIFPGEAGLDSTVFVIRSNAETKPPELEISCAIERKLLFSKVSESANERVEAVFVRFGRECRTIRASLALSGSNFSVTDPTASRSFSERTIPVETREKRFVALSNLSDDALFLFARDSKEAAEKFSQAATSARQYSSGSALSDRLRILALSYRALALHSKARSARAMLSERKNLAYLVPVAGKGLPSDFPFIPGSGRPYRKGVTDGVHHGWDVMAPVWTPVRALAAGVVIRTEAGFSWKDFDRVVKTPVTEDDWLRNLDVYRGNQVWLKTADGNVTFYSHLRDIAPGIEAGVSVASGEMLWTIGVSGVPDRAYKNPHLHFEIQKNPHDPAFSGDFLEIMRWKYLWSGMGKAAVAELAGNTFR